MGKQLARNDSSVRTEAKKSISLPYTERRSKQRPGLTATSPPPFVRSTVCGLIGATHRYRRPEPHRRTANVESTLNSVWSARPLQSTSRNRNSSPVARLQPSVASIGTRNRESYFCEGRGAQRYLRGYVESRSDNHWRDTDTASSLRARSGRKPWSPDDPNCREGTETQPAALAVLLSGSWPIPKR